MKKRHFGLVSIVASLLLVFQNCSEMESTYDDQRMQVSESDFISSQQSCQFIGPDGVASVLRNILNLPSGDTAMVNEKGEPLKSDHCKSFRHKNDNKSCFYLAEYKEDLTTSKCDASTFRLVSQIYINACTEALTDQETARRLFPNGSRDSSQIHMAFTGRGIRADEVQILQVLADEFVGEQEKMTAICAAVGSSLAAINSF